MLSIHTNKLTSLNASVIHIAVSKAGSCHFCRASYHNGNLIEAVFDFYHPLSTVSVWFWDQYGNPIIFPYLPSTSHTNWTRILAFCVRKRVIKIKPNSPPYCWTDSPCRLVHHRLSTASLFIRIVACPVLSLYWKRRAWRLHVYNDWTLLADFSIAILLCPC